ncbi:LacI family transcriptional regulator [Arthrobacter livingstonensis]|uniref:LacI family transcriptional regulator n=1 Tax=Arthrobacter livingstonensis TaxID=670078 RepID=A0A2V5L1J5_9MICC|nr:LacI family DNA-binding transcriptional regulator [Arthrobacter livingstonensis]PYI64878.1 LacI family transcriptional regulator [Arthrobacter livingstonensis]
MAVKLSEVARQAGVSLATASRVLNGSARTPAADISHRVKAAAEELGYVANAQAQALARSTTGLVGLVVHDIADPYFSAIAHGVQETALHYRHQVLLAGTDIAGGAEPAESAELAAVNAFISYRTDAIILAASRLADEDPRLSRALGRYIENGGRVVALGATAIPGAQSLSLPNKEGAADLAGALLKQGHTRFAVLAGPLERNTARHRVEGFARALADAGVEPLAVVPGAFNSQGGFDATLECLDTLGITAVGRATGNHARSAPLCILAANDVMALGAMTALRSRGLRIPRDVQVAGFDDIPTLRDHSPGLTTYRLPLEHIGRLAAELALDPDGKHGNGMGGEVVLRESAGAARLEGA